MSEEWEPVETYCGCDIVCMWSPLYNQYLYTSNCDPHLRFTLTEERNYIKNTGHCDTPTPGEPTPSAPPAGLNRGYLGFKGKTILQRVNERGIISVLTCGLRLYGRANQPPARAIVHLAGDSDDWNESGVNWYNQPAPGIKVGELSQVPTSEGYFSIPLDYGKVAEVPDMTLQLTGNESGVNSYFYAKERETLLPPKLTITGIKVM